MGISFIALNRVAEDRAAAEPAYRRELERNGKTLLSQARLLTDAELLAKLRSFGIELDKPSYLEQCQFALSAEEMSQVAVTSEVRARFRGRFDEDWIWFALTVLWERWFAGLANYEQLDDRMQLGYSEVKADSVAACEYWFLAWNDFLSLYDRGDFKSVETFDADFRGTQFVSNWVHDFETELMKAAMQDARWQRRHIEFCEQYLQQFSLPNDLTTENMRRSLAEAMFEAGEPGKGDALFEQWLKDDPQWGWGWIGWSDCYFQFAVGQNRDLQRAEQVLKQGLDVSNVRDRNDIQERLADLYEEQGRHAESQAIRETLASATSTVEVVGDDQLSIRTKLNFGDEGLPLDQLSNVAAEMRGEQEQVIESVVPVRSRAVGRNEPCPCGSGKKYKKCCLAKDEEQARRAAAAKTAAQLAETEAFRRLDVSAPAPPAPVTVLPDPDAPFRDDEAGADSLPPELHRKFDELWDGFLAVRQPTAGQMDAFLDGLLEFPPDATSWGDLLHRFARAGHPDLPAVFRRISNRVAHTKEAGMCYFYWGAAEESVRCGHRELLPEVATGFRKLDSESYDADALKHLEDWLLAEGLETETLALGEHFLPILRADDELVPWAAPELANLIFELRVGRHLRAGADPEASVERLAEELRRDLDEDVSPEAARSAAGVITGQSPPPAWSRSEFALVTGDISTDAGAWQECLRLFRTLMHVAREAWQVEQYPPACALRGLNLMLNSVYRAQDDERKKRKKAPQDLLDHLLPAGLEARLVRAAGDLIGVNEPRARLLLDSHGILLRFAERHELMSEADVARSRQNLERLRHDLDRH